MIRYFQEFFNALTSVVCCHMVFLTLSCSIITYSMNHIAMCKLCYGIKFLYLLFHFSRVITHNLCALGVLVKIRGEADCSWNETKTVRWNGNDEIETRTYKDHDLYFENHVTLFGGSGKKT